MAAALAILFVTLIIPCLISSTPVSVNNDRIVVKIDDQVTIDNCTQFQIQLEELFNSTAFSLHQLTQGRIAFPQVHVILPENASAAIGDCYPGVRRSSANGQSSDVVIGSTNPLLGDIPWAEQYGGCGVAGLRIRLSDADLKTVTTSNVEYKGKRFVREWIKYRYGVFEESGFENDYQYPLQANFSFCPSDCEQQNETDCNNSTLAACDVTIDEKLLPTKQNILCAERSIMDVLEKHIDLVKIDYFTNDTTVENATAVDSVATTEYTAPVFEYFFPSSGKRYVLLLDRSNQSSLDHWTVLRRSLYRWVHSLPDDTLLSIVVAAQDASQVLPWTRVTSDNRDGLLGRIPRRPLTQDGFCLTCGLKAAFQLLSQEDEGVCCGAGSVVLISGSADAPDDLDEISGQLLETEASLHRIAFPSQSALIDFPLLTSRTSSLNLAVPMADAAGTLTTAITQARLTQALLQVLRAESGSAPTQIYEEFHEARDGNAILGSFTLDSSLGHNVWIVAHCEDEADLDTVEVVSPTGTLYDLPFVSDGMLYIRIPDTNEFGDWSYRIRFTHPVKNQSSAAVEVTSQPNKGQSSKDVITTRAWTSVGNRPVNASLVPVIFYAEVKQGQLPVLDAKVTFHVQRPGALDVKEVTLHDRGTGDPDITHADGIYSAYFTHAAEEEGHYAITVSITDNRKRASVPVANVNKDGITSCCGSVIPYSDASPSRSFTRILSVSSIPSVGGPSNGSDVYPPSRITDLRVARIVPGSNEVELLWTSPGGNFDQGTAALYEIRCYTDRSALNGSASAILVHSSLTPPPSVAGTQQHAMVAVPWPNQQFYYAMIAVDEAGNRGSISNVVPVYIHEPPPPPTTVAPVTEIDSAGFNSSSFNDDRDLPGRNSRLNQAYIYAIAGGVAGVVLLILLLSAAVCCTRRRKTPEVKKAPTSSTTEKKNNVQMTPAEVKIGKEANLTDEKDRPVYQIYVNNAYIQEEEGGLKIVTPDGRILQSGSPWFTLPRGRSTTTLHETSLEALHWSLPRSKNSTHRHKVLTNGSIMQNGGAGGSQVIVPPPGVDGTSISSKPSVSSEDTGIEVNDPQMDSRDVSDSMLLPPPGFGGYQTMENSYISMYGGGGVGVGPSNILVPPLPASPRSQDARVVRIPGIPASSYTLAEGAPPQSWLAEFNDERYLQPSSRRPLIGASHSFREPGSDPVKVRNDVGVSYSQRTSTGPKKKRHVSFV